MHHICATQLQAVPEGPETTVLHSGWALDKVEVLNRASGLKSTYNYNAWVTREMGHVTVEEATSTQVSAPA